MFRHKPFERSWIGLGFETLELIYHVSVRNLRRSHNNAMLGLVMSIVQSLIMLLVMFFMMQLFGMRRIAVRGDFMLYVMSGVFMYMTHIKTIRAVSGADGPTSAMMMHAPMNPIISIMGAALAALYQQTLSAAAILFVYHAAWSPITIDEPVGLLGMHLLSWFSGIGIGMVFLSAKPWQPELIGIVVSLYTRANVIASGKMVLANNLAPNRRAWFDWNPLFHTIDQTRGFVFLNYTPRYTSYEYAICYALVCILIGLMAEFFTRQHASVSWGKGR
ncbi:ABC transporter permease [Tabrizicola sp.]|jgi:ABC-type polysaccharide/polyol phosphate export permease|uniref:ABC transporter permease n=1 Tax=Tabrizicola sp. TaxID=2005166 RepID=UPI001A3939B9|nr:ABC transporter permease [Tabrizicola sp.]MBL9063098.1 ABC transporter permease [Tabrizicola sp.]